MNRRFVRHTTAALIFGVGLLAADLATAAPIYYATRAAFDAANPGTVLEDFEDFDAAGTTQFAAPIDSSSSIAGVLSPGDVEAGVTFALTGGSTDAYFAAPGQSSNPTNAIGVNVPATSGWDISFSGGVNALAFDVFQNFGGGSQSGAPINATVNLYGAGNVLLDSVLVSIPSGGAGFFGVFTGLDLITHATVNNADSFDVIDNVAFAQASVPEPATLLLFGTAAAFGGFRRIRRQRARR